VAIRVLRNLGWLVLSVGLAVVAPASRALQPEPEMTELMVAADVDAATAGPAAGAMMGARAYGSPGEFVPGGHGGPGGSGRPGLLPPFIHLSEQQQDKLFDLRHAQEPALRAQFKELRSAHEQLRALALADNFDETHAKQVITRVVQAESEIELMHARLQHAAFALLTPEQRKRLDECKPGAEGVPPRGCLPPR
jgi:Spy/CpxP family protein refolding chaperone